MKVVDVNTMTFEQVNATKPQAMLGVVAILTKSPWAVHWYTMDMLEPMFDMTSKVTTYQTLWHGC